MRVDSVKLAEEEILELKLNVLADKEAVLDAWEVGALKDGDVLIDLVKLTEEDILELKLTVLSDEEALLRVSEVDGLKDQEME